MSDTPRTDEQSDFIRDGLGMDMREVEIVPASLARQLERELAQCTQTLTYYITQAKARDNGLSVSDLRPILVRYLRGEISEGMLIEELRLAALATVEKLTAQATKERDDAVRERDEARHALREAIDEITRQGVIGYRINDAWDRWHKAAGIDNANKGVRGANGGLPE